MLLAQFGQQMYVSDSITPEEEVGPFYDGLRFQRFQDDLREEFLWREAQESLIGRIRD